MATPYFKKDTTYVYFDEGMILPYLTEYDRHQAVGRAEDGTLKVYDHSLGGTYKRRWKLKAFMNNSAVSDHKFSDFISFLTTTIVHAKYQFSYYDKDGSNYTVRLIRAPSIKLRHYESWEVVVLIEEDY